MKIREALKEATKVLGATGIDSAAIDAKVLLAFILDLDTSELFMKYEEELEGERQKAFNQLVLRRKSTCPIAYITGHREFYSLDFIVNENVLIPRPETEILVEKSLEFLNGKNMVRVLDMCTGSGNIPITLCHEAKKRGQKLEVQAFDISAEALDLANQNKSRHGIENLTLFQHDLFKGMTGTFEDGYFFDLITANPPYVPLEEKPLIASDVIDYEPHIALFEEDNGCRAIFKIIKEAKSLLKAGGLLLVEISSDKQSEYIEGWFRRNELGNYFSAPFFIRDYAGINRFLRLTKNKNVSESDRR